jgi:3-isopropylmalate/(R)-2-methylmalate dehydratase large subunit
MGSTLLKKVWDLHTVRRLPTGQTQLFIGLHLVHEVTSPQACDMLRLHGRGVAFPDRTWATVDHIVPTDGQTRPFADDMAEQMTAALERNCREFRIPLFDLSSPEQGIVHVMGPELGLTQPGMTIACGDSHTSTHGAFGSIAFGIGTSQVRDVLASQSLAMEPLKARRVDVTGALSRGVYAKDVALAIIRRLGVNGGVGYAYEYSGAVVARMTMEERMTLCNMSIEGGARVGYVNPDQTTFDYVRGRRFAPAGEAFDRACQWWRSIASDADASYDDRVAFDGAGIAPMVTWGVNPGQSLAVDERVPAPDDVAPEQRNAIEEALAYMDLTGRQPIAGTKVDVAFIGSCTNGRLSDLRAAADVVKGRKVASHVRLALAVPGSQRVKHEAEAEGLHEIFREAGFEWREAGCSMCLAMNPDRINGRELCASSSNRNFKGRQGSPTGRTVLMSPAMVAAAAVAGEIVDVRTMLHGMEGA